ncbi:MAG: DUF1318 domain-containing protein, partial [Spirochaetia bacterium]|nr:DUF1318 domain-containing protein [Spirochaetia bacterium]
ALPISQTALERQLIGDDVELEENGWLIASAKSSKGHAQNQEISKAQAMYREIGILEYLEEDIQKYKKSGVIGESFNGELKILPPGIRASVDADEISKVSLIVQETNRARVNIYNYFLKSKDKNKGRAWTDKNYKYKYFNLVKSGEWKQNKNGSWEKIK